MVINSMKINWVKRKTDFVARGHSFGPILEVSKVGPPSAEERNSLFPV